MTRFKITIKEDDPPEGYDEVTVVYREFEDRKIKSTGTTITAKEWAEDYAYNLAEKRAFTVEDVT